MPPEKLFLKKLDCVSHGVEAFLHTWASQGRRALCGVALTCWCRNRVGGRRGSPASLYPHPVRSAHAHATLILETCKSGCRLGRRLIAVTEFPTVIIPVPGSQPSLYPARWLPRLRRRAGVAPLVQGRGGGGGGVLPGATHPGVLPWPQVSSSDNPPLASVVSPYSNP